jgi:hypothetical protein
VPITDADVHAAYHVSNANDCQLRFSEGWAPALSVLASTLGRSVRKTCW